LATDVSTTTIDAQDNPVVNITNITETSGGERFTISASGAISKVNKMLFEDNRLVIDFYNAVLTFDQYNFSSDNVKAVRYSQFTVTPQKITRVVFDLQTACNYDISISSDRKTLYVNFLNNRINDVFFTNMVNTDIIRITANTTPVVDITTDEQNVFIDIHRAEVSKDFAEMPVSGRYTSNMNVTQLDSQTVRLTLTVSEMPDFTVVTDDDSATVYLSKIEQMAYANHVISINKSVLSGTSTGAITQDDNYNASSYSFIFPESLGGFLGMGVMNIGDDYINNISVSLNAAGQTVLTVSETQILAAIISEDAVNIYIKMVTPKEKYPYIVVLDPGHGAQDPGAVVNGIKEKTLNLAIIQKAYKMLNDDGIVKAYATRLDDSYPANPDRAKMANQIADMFVSVHHNSAGTEEKLDTTPYGTEVYYYNHKNETSFTSDMLAQLMLDNVSSYAGTKNRYIVNSPLLIVLNQTAVPACLIEVAFMPNPGDQALMVTDDFQTKVARAIADSIEYAFTHYDIRGSITN